MHFSFSTFPLFRQNVTKYKGSNIITINSFIVDSNYFEKVTKMSLKSNRTYSRINELLS